MRADPDNPNQLLPDLAEKAEVSADGRTVRFQLRKGVVFHNGSALTPDDVVYSLNRIKSPPKGIVSPRKGLLGNVEDIRPDGALGVTVRLAQPQPDFLMLVSNPFNVIISRAVAEPLDQQGQGVKRQVVGTGPFRLTQAVDGQYYELTRFDRYFGPAPLLDRIQFFPIRGEVERGAALQSKRIDACFFFANESVLDPLRKVPGITALRRPTPTFVNLIPNVTRKPFDDVRVREALSLAIDREAFIKTVGPLTGAAFHGRGLMPPDSPYSLTPQEIKAGILNTADHDLYLGPAHTGPRYDVLRAGAGRIDAQAAVASDTIAYVKGSKGIVNVSFGVMNVKNAKTVAKTVRIADKRLSGAARTYKVSVNPINKLPGATFSVSPRSITLTPGQKADVNISLSVDPKQLRHLADPTLDLDPLDAGIMREWLTDASGLLKAKPSDGSQTLRLAVFAAPRPASAMSGGSSVTVTGSGTQRTGTLTLTGKAIATPDDTTYTAQNSQVAAFQLIAESDRIPDCQGDDTVGCIPFEDASAADIRYVGFTSDAPLVAAQGQDPLSGEDAAMAYLGITAWGFWRTPSDMVEYAAYLDTNNDGTPEAMLLETRLASDIFATAVLDVRDPENPAMIDLQLLNNTDGSVDTAKFHSTVMMLPFSLGALANPVNIDTGDVLPAIITADSPSLWMTVVGSSAEGTEPDSVGPVKVNLLQPALTAFDAQADMPMVEAADDTLSVSLDSSAITGPAKLLLLHFHNALAKKGEVVPVLRQTTTKLNISPTTVSKGQRADATISVLEGNQVGPGNAKVAVYDGSRKLLTATVVGGTGTFSLPALSVGTHRITAEYLGSAKYAPSTSRVIRVQSNG